MKRYAYIICSLLVILSCFCFLYPNVREDNVVYATSEKEYVAEAIEEDVLPSEYCLRDDYILFAQNQDKHGYCWNFASTMSASTTIMKATNEYYDFSELWSGIATYKSEKYHEKVGSGGTFTYFNNGIQKYGLMLESDLPYQQSYVVSNENVADYYNFYNQYSNVDLARCLQYDYFSKTKVEDIKRYIYDNGSMYVSFYFKQGFIPNEKGVYYKVPNQNSTNSHHAVSIIGWDDNFERDIYLNGSKTPTKFKGAWLIMNSYTETSGTDGINLLFYNDTNITSMYGYKYVQDTTKDLYFYDKIESGYEYPIDIKGKYYGDLVTTDGVTKQKNIFYDDVNLEYSYIISDGDSIKSIDVYLDNYNVTDLFDIDIDNLTKRFTISRDKADFGNYKVIVTYGNDTRQNTYLNNFYVTYGFIREQTKYNGQTNEFGFNRGKDLEYYSYNVADKDYIIYTNKLSGTLSFGSQKESVYAENAISFPDKQFQITDGEGCTVTYSFTEDSGYELEYNFIFEYYEDTTLQPVNVYYDLDGGVNHPKNYSKELANATNDLALYEPTRDGYTFAGWYLDYGNGSKKLSEIDDVYYIDWDDIHHMGENPTLYALSHYKGYYKNSNTVFIYAHWEEKDYYNIDVSITGNGVVEPDKNILISSDDVVKYSFTPASGWCLSALKIDGVAVTNVELKNILDEGLEIRDITKDVSIEAVFTEGTLVLIDIGENIKSAYLITTVNGITYKFYDGDIIMKRFLPKSYNNKFELIVEVNDDIEGYTYKLENVGSYEVLSKGVFKKSVYINKNVAYKESVVGSAVLKEKSAVKVTYNTNSYVIDHYLSSDKNAKSGVKGSGEFMNGEVVYVFIKKPLDTKINYYYTNFNYEKVDNQWCRVAVYVDGDNTNLGSYYIYMALQSYIITFKNWDGTILDSEEWDYYDYPYYTNMQDEPPTRPEDEKYSYVFIGWDKVITTVSGPATYTAVYTRIAKEYTINVENTENGSVTPSGNNVINYEDVHTYLFTPDEGYKVKDVKINGVSVGAVTSYTFRNITSNQSVSVEFEKIKYDINIVCGENGSSDKEGITSVDYNSVFSVIFTPDDGFNIKDIKVDGISIGAVNNYTFMDINSNHTITAEFEIKRFVINVVIEGEGEYTCNQSLDAVQYGEDRVVSLFSKDGWNIGSIYVNGEKVEAADSLSIEDIDKDVEILVIFELNDWVLIITNVTIVALMAIILSTLMLVLLKFNKKKNYLQ